MELKELNEIEIERFDFRKEIDVMSLAYKYPELMPTKEIGLGIGFTQIFRLVAFRNRNRKSGLVRYVKFAHNEDTYIEYVYTWSDNGRLVLLEFRYVRYGRLALELERDKKWINEEVADLIFETMKIGSERAY